MLLSVCSCSNTPANNAAGGNKEASTADELLREFKGESGRFTFEVPFKNKSTVMESESFTKTDPISYPEEESASGSITYKLEIKQTPK